MLEEKLVSIVMPVYNSKDYIQEAILSIINQTYKNWELLIVNEFGSDEYCTMLVSRFVILDDRIRLLQNEEKLGISESLNVGLRSASGEYIARMDADDIALPNRIKEQVEFLEKNPDILLCGTRVEVFGSESWNWEVETNKNIIATNILFYSPCVHPTIMFRKELISKNGVCYNKDYKASEDYDFFSKVLKFGKISNINKVLFRYRLYGSNATYINNNIGYIIYNEVMDRQFKELGLNFTKSEIENLSVHYSMKGLIGQKAIIRLIELDLLLKKILLANEKKKIYDKEFLFVTLHRRFKEAFDSMSWQCSSYNTEKAKEIYEKSIFKNEFFYKQISVSKKNPEVTVLMPTYNSENYIAESIWSILNQSFSDFELLIINEATTKDNTLEMIKLFDDNRIIVEQNKTRLGLAESLNKGIKMAKGKFIARIDADDISHIDRLKIQYKFFKENPEYSFCGTWQRHFGIDTDFIHEAAVEHDEIKARLIYDCDICHSTIMFKKKAFIDNNLLYDKSKQAEDYELWTRAIHKIRFHNIPIVLGEYRVGNDNITKAKLQALSKESGEIAYKNITEYLKVNIPKEHIKYLSGWINEFNNIDNDELYKKHIDIEKNIIIQMYNNNLNLKEYNNKDLLITINKRWSQVINKKPISVDFNTVTSVEDLISLYQKKDNENLEIIESNTKKDSFKQFIKKILKFPYKPFKHGMLYRIRRQLWDLDGHLKESSENIKSTIWDSEGHIKDYCRDKIKELESKISSDIDSRFITFLNKLDELSEVVNRVQEYDELKLNYILKYIGSKSIETEKMLLEKFDTRIWKAEENLGQQLDARVWKAEEFLESKFNERGDMIHRHIDFTYSDILILLNNNIKHIDRRVNLDTRYPIAYESNDHIVPHGTIRDNTRYPRFIYSCERYFGKNEGLYFMDLGCSGGGIVLDALLRGHMAIGLEGSDVSLKQQRAEWRVIPNHLFTCDITKPFYLYDLGDNVKFDVISAWEVMEHIRVEDLDGLIKNIKNHLKKGGIFVASIANWDDIDEETGVNWHVNQHDYKWWSDEFTKYGFELITDSFSPMDMARGTINPSLCYQAPYKEYDLSKTFYIVLKSNF